MLQSLHALVLQLVEFRFRCLLRCAGNALEADLRVAAAGHLIFVAPGAMLGQPEVKLAVFAPAASCLLPEHIRSQAQAEDLLFYGRSITADEAMKIGLVTMIDEDPEQAALDYFDQNLAPLSAESTLRYAVRAVRGDAI